MPLQTQFPIGQHRKFDYSLLVQNIGNLLEYWPLNEESGTTTTAIISSARNGTYVGNVQLNAIQFLDNLPAVKINGGFINLWSSSLNTAWKGGVANEFTISGWLRLIPDSGSYTGCITSLYSDGDNYINQYAYSSSRKLQARREAANNLIELDESDRAEDGYWFHFAHVVSVSGGYSRLYINAELVDENTNALSNWADVNLYSTITGLGAANASLANTFPGYMARWSIHSEPLSIEAIKKLYHYLATTKYMMFVGDSKTANQTYPTTTCRGHRSSAVEWLAQPTTYAAGGWTVANVKSYVETNLSSETINVSKILINLGANDVSTLPTEELWKSNLTSIIDAFREKWPNVKLYIAKAWRRNYATECNSLASWIDDVVSSYSANVYLGHDERIWLEGGDDGATMTSDGTHYSPSGVAEVDDQWLSVL